MRCFTRSACGDVRRAFVDAILLFIATAAGSTIAAAAEGGDSPPNFVIVLADDLGYGDVGCYGHDVIQTPRIDSFARQGLRFTNCYSAAPNCSPARTGLMTGRTPSRVGIHNWIPWVSPMHVREHEITIASLLQQAGYDTCHVGKWHLNGRFNFPEQPQPSDHGFGYWFATQNNALPNHRNPTNFVRNGKAVGRLEGYASQLVADEAVEWLRNHRDPAKPFFLNVCFHEPHEPIASAPAFEKMYAQFDDPSQRAHHGNVTQMDDAFGRLLDALDQLELAEDTVVFFTSDNGPAITGIHPHGSSGPLRAKKGHLYEGGIRVPGILRWPGHATAGEVSDQPICGVDVLPTFCDISGVAAPSDRPIDGASFLPALRGQAVDRSTPLYWHFNQAASEPKVAMRIGDWKILARLSGPEVPPGGDIVAEHQEAFKQARVASCELYNLRNCLGETTDVAEQEPEKLQAMREQLERVYASVVEESPVWPEWRWPRLESQQIQWPEYRKRR